MIEAIIICRLGEAALWQAIADEEWITTQIAVRADYGWPEPAEEEVGW